MPGRFAPLRAGLLVLGDLDVLEDAARAIPVGVLGRLGGYADADPVVPVGQAIKHISIASRAGRGLGPRPQAWVHCWAALHETKPICPKARGPF